MFEKFHNEIIVWESQNNNGNLNVKYVMNTWV